MYFLRTYYELEIIDCFMVWDGMEQTYKLQSIVHIVGQCHQMHLR